MDEIKLLEEFSDLADSGRLFLSRNQAWYVALRFRIKKALDDLLFFHRPGLEQLKGIDWAYSIFIDRLGMFEGFARHHNEFVALQAKLFLSLLPFPGQWAWIDKMSVDYEQEPEIRAFLENEKRLTQEKIKKKSYKRFRLRNFCQILKAPNPPREKGVLRIFSIPYLFFPVPELLEKISNDYLLYVEPAAGITFRHTWMRIYSRFKDPVLFGLSSHEDRNFVLGQQNTVTTRIAHGDYLDVRIQEPDRIEKQFDLVFNNTFDERERKRHSLMLDLMDDPRLKNIRVLFMGRGSLENVENFKGQIHKRGLDARVLLLANLPRKQVDFHLAQCRLGVHLSLMENGCRAVYEYFRANLPCIMSSCTAGMDQSIINPATGVLVPDKDLAQTMAQTLEQIDRFSPRKWFLENSGSFNSTKRLNTRLKNLFQSLGYEWHKDIVTMTSSGVGRYADPQDLKGFKKEFQRLTDLFAGQTGLPIHLD